MSSLPSSLVSKTEIRDLTINVLTTFSCSVPCFRVHKASKQHEQATEKKSAKKYYGRNIRKQATKPSKAELEVVKSQDFIQDLKAWIQEHPESKSRLRDLYSLASFDKTQDSSYSIKDDQNARPAGRGHKPQKWQPRDQKQADILALKQIHSARFTPKSQIDREIGEFCNLIIEKVKNAMENPEKKPITELVKGTESDIEE